MVMIPTIEEKSFRCRNVYNCNGPCRQGRPPELASLRRIFVSSFITGIRQVSTEIEETLVTKQSVDDTNWAPISASPNGLPLVDLGSAGDADIGDVVYMAATIHRDTAVSNILSLGASSTADVWVNGEKVAYAPNLLGLSRDEVTAPITLRAGKNQIIIKLQRYWERRWLFYTSLLDNEKPNNGISLGLN